MCSRKDSANKRPDCKTAQTEYNSVYDKRCDCWWGGAQIAGGFTSGAFENAGGASRVGRYHTARTQ